jgi:PfaB family protein
MAERALGTGLVVIGMEVVRPACPDISVYGHSIYRGFNQSASLTDSHDIFESFFKSLSQLAARLRIQVQDIQILSLHPELSNKLQSKSKENLISSTLTSVDGVFESFTNAANILESELADSILIIDHIAETRGYCALLLSSAKFANENNKEILAEINALEPGNAENFSSLLSNANSTMSLNLSDIGLVITTDSLDLAQEIVEPADLIASFSGAQMLQTALTQGAGGLMSVIKAVWCLSNRVIPGSPDWKTPDPIDPWKTSAFYVPMESRTWFLDSENDARHVVVLLGKTVTSFKNLLIISENKNSSGRFSPGLSRDDFFLFPISGASATELDTKLQILNQEIQKNPDIRQISSQYLNGISNDESDKRLTVCILGHNPEEIIREIDFAVKGLPVSIEKGIDWRTPMGSFFSPSPLGIDGEVSFVYPGAFNSYPGVAKDLLYLFPILYENLAEISSNLSGLINEKMLYPRSISALSQNDLEMAEKKLAGDPLAMLISGTCLAVLYTHLLRDVISLHPGSSIGYSLGEISMMFSSGVWTKADETSSALRSSPLFNTRLAGPQDAVRENWGLPPRNELDSGESIWANFVLMASPEAVNYELVSEKKVYITHINTPRQVVIGGDPESCLRVISKLKCTSLQAPFDYALHCQAMESEYESLKTLHTWPVSNQPGMKLYSAANYDEFPLEQEGIAHQIAYGLSHKLDFPRLVNKAYECGAKIFIELGAGSNCARWVDECLKGKPHAAFSINRKGVDDQTAILQLLAKMISHQVPLDLTNVFVKGS